MKNGAGGRHLVRAGLGFVLLRQARLRKRPAAEPSNYSAAPWPPQPPAPPVHRATILINYPIDSCPRNIHAVFFRIFLLKLA
ncbi:hypothetical protein [Ottowia sp.]|jgi:hypothetical protein|uniref:hypothetical protein n=1 Tax=Ottowia sp. TaxID=1898956 RepID=UPI0025CDD191|nr:hypothetical protein [Ottowia sp.]MBK6615932.1 hypothetical protein [Ottowia sp.]MBK6747054.1 hypothetical protein [Ottowia sp.]